MLKSAPRLTAKLEQAAEELVSGVIEEHHFCREAASLSELHRAIAMSWLEDAYPDIPETS